MTVRPGQPPQPRFVVFDRNGTIIEEREYLSEPEQVRLIPGVGAALRELLQMGFGLVVITNQSGIGRGFFDRFSWKRFMNAFANHWKGNGFIWTGSTFARLSLRMIVPVANPGWSCCRRQPGNWALIRRTAL